VVLVKISEAHTMPQIHERRFGTGRLGLRHLELSDPNGEDRRMKFGHADG
jgi:hypothetical protein